MRDLHFITAAYKLSAIPETSAGFCGKNINRAGNGANDPAADIVYFFVLHVI
jgi:hypothetical protein